MDEAPGSDQPNAPKPWGLWALSMLSLFGMSTGLRYIIVRMTTVFEQLGMTMLPQLTRITLELGPYLWIPVLAVAAEGLRRIQKKDRANALSWCLGSMIAYLAVFFAMVLGLYFPMLHIQQSLSK